MRVAVLKPELLPGIAFFDRINSADKVILLDSIKLNRRDPVSRTKVLCPGGTDWIHIPLARSVSKGPEISGTRIDYTRNWQKNLLNRLYHSYKTAPYFDDIFPVVSEILKSNFDYISELNEALITRICAMLQIDCITIRSSELDVSGDGDTLLLNLVRSVQGTGLILPENAISFVDSMFFGENGIEIEFREFQMPEYNQYLDRFYPGLSIFDTFCFCGRYHIHTHLSSAR